ncbi:MAG: ATP-dependent helicase HrpB [Paracoccaceae bacterium]
MSDTVPFPDPLPIDGVIPVLQAAMAANGMAVLQAPPGAGKTTRVPLALLAQVTGRILLLEPRRLSTRAAAARMAETLGEPLGQTVGYRIRGESRTGAQTRIEVVTEGILTRMIQSDADLPGVGLIIFDEFHERSLQADLGLALALEIRGALRPDLQLLVMSATLDAAPVAALMGDAPLITSAGRAFEVETRWLARPVDSSLRYESAVAGLIRQAVEEVPSGDVLVFLPGEGEIRRVEAQMQDHPGLTIRPLFGAMEFSAQQEALTPAPGRKLVLATSIAETSLTIPGVRVVIDGGRARRGRFDPASGMSRLVTERVTKAEAEQRRGRAGRVAPGVCYRLWTRGEEGGMPAFPPAEIDAADLTPLALELALWGATDLPFLTPPHPGILAEAQGLLQGLGALDAKSAITAHGRALAALPLHPRLAHMLVIAGPKAAPLAALLAERDPLRGAGADLMARLKAIEKPPAEAHRLTIERIRAEARRLTRLVPTAQTPDLSPAQMAALAYPDRIGVRRAGDAPRWVLSGGKGAAMAIGQPLSATRLIVATDLDGDPREAQVRQAVAITEAELRTLYADQIGWADVCEWSRRDGKVLARKQERFGALVLAERNWPDAPPDALARAALDGLRQIGLPWTASARRLRARLTLARSDDWPTLDDEGLLATAERWLLPYLAGKRSESDLRALDLTEPLRALIGWDRMAQTDAQVPGSYETPLGRKVPIDYGGDHPSIELRLQELFGVTRHPTVGPAHLPLRITLLSPGQRPVQVTLDLPRFWATSYADVRKDMRGQYPRHPWPEDPTAADPTLRAKPRGT